MMKNKTKCHIFCVAATALIFAAEITYYRDCFSVSNLMILVVSLSVIPLLVLLINPRSKFSNTIAVFALITIFIFGLVYGIYNRVPLGFVILFSQVIAIGYLALADKPSCKESLPTKMIAIIVSLVAIANIGFISNQLFRIENAKIQNGGTAMWNRELAEFAATLCHKAETDEEKVQTIYTWIKDNIEYDENKNCVYQYFNVNDTMKTKKGLCFDYASLFTAMCRSQSIPCLNIDGYKYIDPSCRHTWNRVFYNGSWYQLDVTFDSTTKGNVPYGFRQIGTYSTPNNDYHITRIY